MEDYKKTDYCTQIQVSRDGQLLKSLIFNQDKIIVGRILSVDLIIDDISISRIHAAIDISDEGNISVSDLGSVNGVEIDGKKVTECKVETGGIVTIGDVELLIDIFKEEDLEETPEPRAPIINSYSELEDVIDLKKLASARTLVVTPKNGKPFSVKPGVSGIFPTPDDRERGSVLEGVVLVNDSILEVKHLHEPKKITIGPDRNNDFIFGASLLPEKFKIVNQQSGKYYIRILDGMKGFIQKGSENIPLEKIKTSPSTKEDRGVYTFPLNYKDIVRIEVGSSSFLFLFVEKSEPIDRKKVLEPDPPFHWSLFCSFVLHLLLVLLFKNADIPENVRLEKIEDRFVNLIIEQKKPIFRKKVTKKPIPTPTPKPTPKKAAKKPEKPKVPPKVNLEKPKEKPKKTKPKKAKPKIVSPKGKGKGRGLKRKTPKNIKSIGILGGLSKRSSTGSLSKLFGKRGVGRGAGKNVAGIRGVRGGSGNYGLKRVKGGVGKTFGVGSGNILGDAGSGTPGLISSSGALKGRSGVSLKAFNALKGSKYTGTTKMSHFNTVVIGSLTKDQIWNVVEKHFSEIQNCYEVALQGDKRLAGKVSMHWVIGADGRVKVVKVKRSTLRNVYAESCMKNRIKYWVFPKPRGGGVVKVLFPFVFKPI